MNIDSATLVYFSPTGTTRKVLEEIAAGARVQALRVIDCTRPAVRVEDIPAIDDDLVILGVPVYSGRLPRIAVAYLGRLQASRTPAVLVAVYGNRAFEDALVELRDLAVAAGCVPVAAGAFIGEHSFSSAATPIAPGRPDPLDLQAAREFGIRVRAKLGRLASLDELQPPVIPGNTPYRPGGSLANVAPSTIADLCTRCLDCVAACPTAAISQDDPTQTDPRRCIVCCACIKVCPAGARVMKDEKVLDIAGRLHRALHERREPEVFI